MQLIFFFALLGSLLFAPAALAQAPQDGWLPVDGLRIKYEMSGAGSPVLLLHAGLQNQRMWDAQVRALARRYQVITLDLPGHGQTTGRDTTKLIGDVLAQMLDQLQIKQVAVVGLSMGSSCALELALAHPERVSKLVLVSAGLSGLESRLDSVTRRIWPSMSAQLARRDTVATAEVFTRYWCDGPYRRPDQVKPAARRYISQTTLATMRQHRLSGGPRFPTQPASERVSQLAMPVLIMVGQQDLLFINRVGEFLQQTLKNHQFVSFPKAGHMLNLEATGRFNRRLKRFLAGR